MEILETANKMVGARGFEPPTPDTPCQCATRLRYAPTGTIPGSTPFLPPLEEEGKGRQENLKGFKALVLLSNIVNFLSKVQLHSLTTKAAILARLFSTPLYFPAKGSFLFAFSAKDHKGKGEYDDTE